MREAEKLQWHDWVLIAVFVLVVFPALLVAVADNPELIRPGPGPP